MLGAGNNETKVDMPNTPITAFSPPEGNTTFIDGTTCCVASPSPNQTDLQMALDWACGPRLTDCSGIQLGQPCYLSSNMLLVASYVFILLQYCQFTSHSFYKLMISQVINYQVFDELPANA